MIFFFWDIILTFFYGKIIIFLFICCIKLFVLKEKKHNIKKKTKSIISFKRVKTRINHNNECWIRPKYDWGGVGVDHNREALPEISKLFV